MNHCIVGITRSRSDYVSRVLSSGHRVSRVGQIRQRLPSNQTRPSVSRVTNFPIECPRPVVVTEVRLGTFRDNFSTECPRPVVVLEVCLGTFRDDFPTECPRPVVVTEVRVGTFRDDFPIECPRPVVVTEVRVGTFSDDFPIE